MSFAKSFRKNPLVYVSYPQFSRRSLHQRASLAVLNLVLRLKKIAPNYRALPQLEDRYVMRLPVTVLSVRRPAADLGMCVWRCTALPYSCAIFRTTNRSCSDSRHSPNRRRAACGRNPDFWMSGGCHRYLVLLSRSNIWHRWGFRSESGPVNNGALCFWTNHVFRPEGLEVLYDRVGRTRAKDIKIHNI